MKHHNLKIFIICIFVLSLQLCKHTTFASGIGGSRPDIPGTPTGVAHGSGSIIVSWTKPTYEGVYQGKGLSIIFFNIYTTQELGVAGLGVSYLPDYYQNNGTTWSKQLVSGLLPLTRYTFQVAAQNSQGAGELSPSSNPILTLPSVPGKPTFLRVNTAVPITTVTLPLAWRAPDNSGGAAITNYVIYYKVNGNIEYIKPGIKTLDSSVSYVKKGLAAFSSYIFCVSAENIAGEGLCGEPSPAFRTLPKVPGKPPPPSISLILENSLSAVWADPKLANILETIMAFKLRIIEDQSKILIDTKTILPTMHVVNFNSLKQSTLYLISLSVSNENNFGNFSDPVSARTLSGFSLKARMTVYLQSNLLGDTTTNSYIAFKAAFDAGLSKYFDFNSFTNETAGSFSDLQDFSQSKLDGTSYTDLYFFINPGPGGDLTKIFRQINSDVLLGNLKFVSNSILVLSKRGIIMVEEPVRDLPDNALLPRNIAKGEYQQYKISVLKHDGYCCRILKFCDRNNLRVRLENCQGQTALLMSTNPTPLFNQAKWQSNQGNKTGYIEEITVPVFYAFYYVSVFGIVPSVYQVLGTTWPDNSFISVGGNSTITVNKLLQTATSLTLEFYGAHDERFPGTKMKYEVYQKNVNDALILKSTNYTMSSTCAIRMHSTLIKTYNSTKSDVSELQTKYSYVLTIDPLDLITVFAINVLAVSTVDGASKPYKLYQSIPPPAIPNPGSSDMVTYVTVGISCFWGLVISPILYVKICRPILVARQRAKDAREAIEMEQLNAERKGRLSIAAI